MLEALLFFGAGGAVGCVSASILWLYASSRNRRRWSAPRPKVNPVTGKWER